MPDLPMYNKERSAMVQSRSKSPKRGLLAYLALFAVLSWTSYSLYTRSIRAPRMEAQTETKEAPEPDEGLREYGLGAQPEFKDLIKLMDLPSDYLPETGKHRHPSRLIVVGDVHGMKDALVDLLDKVKFNKKHDHLILAGDMISKGPDSPGVVDLAMKLGATGVRGNHEDRVLLAHRRMMAAHAAVDVLGPSGDREKVQDTMEDESFSHVDYKDRKLIKALGKHRIKWLKKCPVILRVGVLGGMGEVVVVHAGLAPGVKLEKQDPQLVMNMRTIGKGGIPSDERDGTHWIKPWNELQKSLPHKNRTTVIYGHDSHRGLQVKKYSMGIDTGCRNGGKLTAVVIEGGHSDHTHRIVQVSCKDRRS